ncbi:hypothetical protein F5Y02DRAFT_422753 [Annulohypoxylon stygium]|nr:hypothetical protein F5Y02DRAFT_422753 [Annulohypoxylon stygium]
MDPGIAPRRKRMDAGVYSDTVYIRCAASGHRVSSACVPFSELRPRTHGVRFSPNVGSEPKDRPPAVHEQTGLLLSIILAFHTCKVFAVFLAPDSTTRHYWTWAWQLTPVWIGVSNLLLSRLASPLLPKSALVVLGLISTVVWVYTLSSTPFYLSTIFIPAAEVKTEFVAHVRKVL